MTGRYLYGVTEGPGFKSAGLDGSPVYPITYQGLSLLIHACGSEPYSFTEEANILRWVVEHHAVLEKAMEECGAVLPLRFNTIVKGTDVKALEWLQENEASLRATLERLRGKSEYGLEVRRPRRTKPEGPEPGGRNYLLAKKAELQALKDDRVETDKLAADLQALLEPWVDDLKFLDGELGDGAFFRVSLLLARERVEAFGVLLDRVVTGQGLQVHFSGPLPPYSFVGDGRSPGSGGIFQTDAESG